MAAAPTDASEQQEVVRRRARRGPLVGLLCAFALMALAMAVPAVLDWNVRVRWFPPLHAEWMPRVGLGTVPALLVAVLAASSAVSWAERLPWRRLLVVSFATGLVWMLSLALVDGLDGVGEILEHQYEYLRTARRTDDVPAMLEEYVSRIGLDADPRNWPTHVAGHPPGAVLFFIALARLGLGSGLAAGLVVTVVAATTAVAVLVTLRILGAEPLARRAAPFLVLGPAAVWQSVSGDAVFAAVGAWGIAALAAATTAGRPLATAAWSLAAGALLGYLVMMSYGLPLFGLLALAVLWAGRRWTPLPIAATTALLVVAVFVLFGFYYWEALPELRERYWDGIASRRPPEYWMWGNLAALMFSAGPLAAAGLAQLGTARPTAAERRARSPLAVVWVVALAGWAMVLAAHLSQMSRAEVERIWLPFVPWLLLGCALLPERWRRRGLVVQLVVALVVQHLLRTSW
jgi:hypothetical protein